MPIKVLELFSGSGRISKECKNIGMFAITCDYDPRYGADLKLDISNIKTEWAKYLEVLGREPDVIWASPDCTTYSIAQHGIHRGHLQQLWCGCPKANLFVQQSPNTAILQTTTLGKVQEDIRYAQRIPQSLSHTR